MLDRCRRRPFSTLRHGSVLKGCLIAAGVVLAILIAVGIYVANNWRGWTAAGLKLGVNQQIAASAIPADQKTRITAKVDSFFDDFAAGKVTAEQMAKATEALTTSPLIPLALVAEADARYLAPSKLSEEEKLAGRRSLERLARGTVEKSIGQADADAVIGLLLAKDANGVYQFRPSIPDQELRAALEAAKSKADLAKVPDESYTLNFADEFDKLIEQARK